MLVLIEGAPGVGKTTFASQCCLGVVVLAVGGEKLLPLRDNKSAPSPTSSRHKLL